jgi:hypothetical protein
MRIAIIGTGIAGNAAAYALSTSTGHDLTIYESQPRYGGHTNTVQVEAPDGPFAVDTGFIVFNDVTAAAGKTLLYQDRELLKKSITLAKNPSQYIVYPASSTPPPGAQTDLFSQVESPSFSGDRKDAVKEMINDTLVNQIAFTDRYNDPKLIDRLIAATTNTSLTVPAGTSYAFFQDKPNDQTNVITARMQLDEFLLGTGYQATYTTTKLDPLAPGQWRIYFDASLGNIGDIEIVGNPAYQSSLPSGGSIAPAVHIVVRLAEGFVNVLPGPFEEFGGFKAHRRDLASLHGQRGRAADGDSRGTLRGSHLNFATFAFAKAAALRVKVSAQPSVSCGGGVGGFPDVFGLKV